MPRLSAAFCRFSGEAVGLLVVQDVDAGHALVLHVLRNRRALVRVVGDHADVVALARRVVLVRLGFPHPVRQSSGTRTCWRARPCPPPPGARFSTGMMIWAQPELNVPSTATTVGLSAYAFAFWLHLPVPLRPGPWSRHTTGSRPGRPRPSTRSGRTPCGSPGSSGSSACARILQRQVRREDHVRSPSPSY